MSRVWHIAAPDMCDGTSAVGESRHRIPGASVGQPTEPCLAPFASVPASFSTLISTPILRVAQTFWSGVTALVIGDCRKLWGVPHGHRFVVVVPMRCRWCSFVSGISFTHTPNEKAAGEAA